MVSMEARSIVGSSSANEQYASAAIFGTAPASPRPTPRSVYVAAPRESIYANGNAFATQSEYTSTSQRLAETVYESTDAPLN
jgi:hypothetical protein